MDAAIPSSKQLGHGRLRNWSNVASTRAGTLRTRHPGGCTDGVSSPHMLVVIVVTGLKGGPGLMVSGGAIQCSSFQLCMAVDRLLDH